jgi:hypothetical protein
MLPEHIQKKLRETRRIDLAPGVKRERQRIAVLRTAEDVAGAAAIPYDAILDGPDAVAAFFASSVDTRPHLAGIFSYSYNELLAVKAAALDYDLRGCVYALHSGASDNEESTVCDTYQSASAFADALGAPAWQPGSKLPRLHLLLQLWKPADADRWAELQMALFKNVTNPLVHKIHILLDGVDVAEVLCNWPAPLKAKVVTYPSTARLSYEFALNYMASLPAGDFAALVNSDIYFDATVRELWSISMKNRCLALLRFEASLGYAAGAAGSAQPHIFGPRADSQDTWIFAVDELVAHQAAGESWRELDFTLGKPGCDNAIAGELLRRKWQLANPAYSIKTLHLHANPRRSYTALDLVSLGLYVHLGPVELC